MAVETEKLRGFGEKINNESKGAKMSFDIENAP